MRNLIVFLGLLLAYTFLYAGFSHFGVPLFAAPKQ